MRRLRVTVTMRKQLDGLRDTRGNVRKGGVMLVPRIMECDEWERLAAGQQDALIASSAEDRAKPGEAVVTTTETDPHRESEKLYQQERKDQIQVFKDYRDAGQEQVRRATTL